MNIEYFVFSGTGNTLMIARGIGSELVKKGNTVNYYILHSRIYNDGIGTPRAA